MLIQPSRRDLLRYTASGLLASKLCAQGMPFPGGGLVHAVSAPSITLLSHGNAAAETGNAVLNSISTIGATLYVVGACYIGGATSLAITDSASNTYTPLTQQTGFGVINVQLFYCQSPTTSGTLQVTATPGGGGSHIFFGFLDFAVASLYNSVEHGNSNIAQTNKPGSTAVSPTPGLIVTVGGGTSANVPTIDSSFLLPEATADVAFSNFMTGVGYKVTSSTEDPRWDAGSGGSAYAASIAAFH